MADLAGTENTKKKPKKSHRTPPPRCANDKQKRAPEEGEGREFQCCAISTRKCLGRLEKDVQPINGLYRELRNPHKTPRKILVD